jgi:hypothetical protein
MYGGNVDRDCRKINQLNLSTMGVSSAWWPRDLRRCIATGEAAQRRRALIMRERGDWHPRLLLSRYLVFWLYLAGLFTILMGGILLGVLVLGPWITFLVLYAVWMLVAALGIWLLVAGSQHVHRRQRVSLHRVEKTLPERTSHVEKTLPERTSHAELHFPTTPMPATPLVRVLETVDLSASGIEHFLDAAMTKSLFEMQQASSVEQELPQSHLAFPTDICLPQSQLGTTFDDETWRMETK